MDDQIMDSIAGFDALWQRVAAHEEPPAQAASRPEGAYVREDTLLRLMHEESCAAAGAAALARLLTGEGRAVLARHAADARRHLRRLRAEYYILTGIQPGSNADCRPVTGRLSSLRDAFLQAGSLARQYEQAAGGTDCPELAAALRAFADDELVRARQLRALLVDSF